MGTGAIVTVMKLVGTRPIRTNRLVLRRWSVDHAQQMYDNWASDTEATRFVTWPPHPNVDATRSLLTGWVHDYDDPATFNSVSYTHLTLPTNREV